MPTDRWRQLAELFEGALEQPASVQGEFVARSCGDDDGLRAELASMLAAAAQSGEFLSEPALDLFARQVSREGWSVQPGDRIGSYIVQRRLGAGGMGEVWQARDERLGRDVAIKLLLPHPLNAAERVRAFEREARAAGALNHTNVLTVHDVGQHRGAPYLVTECLEGESLRARLRSGGLPVDTSLDIAVQTARGLAAAHARGIVHRDLKPENIFLASDGRVKILDFGLATLHDVAPQVSSMPDRSIETARSLAMGTAGYMAPEQVRGEAVDCRADIFALGAVLKEMLTGHSTPTLSRIVRRCLSPSPDDRYPSAAALASALDAVVKARSLPRPSVRALLRRPIVVLMVLLVAGAIAAGGWRWWVTASRGRWARTVAAPEVQRLLNRGDYFAAFVLTRQALDVLPDDPQLRALWLDVSIRQVVATDPQGAEVAFAAYGTRSPDWVALGRTPLSDVRLPRGQIRLRISKAGYQPLEVARTPPGWPYRLDPVASVPPGMVRVVGGRAPARPGLVGTIDDYWIGRFEVTNRQFKAFMDAGGYSRRDYWREPFISGGRSLRWEDAMARFRDTTGRPGPSTWVSGTYPAGKADHPVAGVSWYEAAAYAAFAGKALPTVHHWFGAAALGRFADILTASNFTGKGPAAVGEYTGLGPFGTYDMAGNVKEWCATASAGRRFVLGGAYDEPRYVFGDYDAREPFERLPSYGFRVAEYDGPLPAALTAPVRFSDLVRDGRTLAPVDDAVFDVWRRQYAYDHEPLNSAVEETEETKEWIRHTVAFDAAYGGERVRAYLFLPRHTSPPYQVVVFFPAGDAFVLRSSRDLSLAWGDFVIRSGRALLYPVYKGTYERSVSEATGPNRRRELRMAWSRDLGRAIDYLETRPDIDPTRIGFYGVSTGADAGLILTALEPRLKVSVLQGTGIWGDEAPESDAFNYAPRVRVPTLMLNGRYDFGTPLETAQRPLFKLLGTGDAHKRHAVFDAGHALRREDVAREALPWLDRYLGPVAAAPRGR